MSIKYIFIGTAIVAGIGYRVWDRSFNPETIAVNNAKKERRATISKRSEVINELDKRVADLIERMPKAQTAEEFEKIQQELIVLSDDFEEFVSAVGKEMEENQEENLTYAMAFGARCAKSHIEFLNLVTYFDSMIEAKGLEINRELITRSEKNRERIKREWFGIPEEEDVTTASIDTETPKKETAQ